MGSENTNGYVRVPRWVAVVLVGCALTLMSAYFGVVVNDVTKDVLALETATEELDKRSRVIETTIGVVNEKLSNIEKSQEQTDRKLDTILQKLKK